MKPYNLKKTATFTLLLILTILIISTQGNRVLATNNTSMTLPISFKIEMLPWKQVNTLLPRYSKFEVIDYETGASFNVQRRAGSKHADVQPLTKKDTASLKKIYNGKWSWDRRAVLVVVHDRLIAASMHGMPHGAGALQNNFPGHFCIHFFESTTHRRTTPDLGHHLMVLRSAGKLDEYLQSLNAAQMVDVCMTAINNNDGKLLKAISYRANSKEIEELLENIEIIKWEKENKGLQPTPLLDVVIPVKVHAYLKEHGLKRDTIQIHLNRASMIEPWKVHLSSLKINNKHT